MQGEPAGPRSGPLAFLELSLFRCACHEHGVASVLVASVAWLLASLPGCPSLRALLPALPERVLPFGHRHTPRLVHQSTCLLPFFHWFLTIFFLVLCYLNFSTLSTFKLKKKKEICNTRISNVTYTSLLPLSQLSVTNSKLVLGPQE